MLQRDWMIYKNKQISPRKYIPLPDFSYAPPFWSRIPLNEPWKILFYIVLPGIKDCSKRQEKFFRKKRNKKKLLGI